MLGDGILRTAILSQMKPLDTKRLYQRIGFAKAEEYQAVEAGIIALIQKQGKM